jgi:hypothetical protein
MLFGLLNFGEGNLALNYLIFCIVASLGTVQFAAARARLIGLLLLPPKVSAWLGAGLVIGAYAWFFGTTPDLFIPGLAGGELSTLAALGFAISVVIALGLGVVSNRILNSPSVRPPYRRERIMLAKGKRAELWLPRAPLSPLVIALREADTDSLDVLCGEFVARGAAVILCDQALGQLAYEYAVQHAPRFNLSRLYVVGVGRGADRALSLQTREDAKFRAVLALGPFGSAENARPGLRWLRETDYLTALRVTLGAKEVAACSSLANALVVYGEEDTLIAPPPHPPPWNGGGIKGGGAVWVAGARHLTLARMRATLTLAGEWFELPPSVPLIPERVPARRRALPGEMPD